MSLILLDASGFIYAAYFRLPGLSRSDGSPTGAIYGFTSMLWKLITRPPEPYTHIAAVFDSGGKNWRHDVDPHYKASRLSKKPLRLEPQAMGVREAARVLGVAALELEGHEADDIIATYTRRARQEHMPVVIVSADKDMMQLLDQPRVRIWNSHPRRKNRLQGAPHWVGEGEVQEKFGVRPELVTDVQALTGDPSDGYQGVRGIGPAKASELVNKYGSIEEIIREADSGARMAESDRRLISRNAETIRMCKDLATLDVVVPLFTPLADLVAKPPLYAEALKFFADHQMADFKKRFERQLPALEDALA